MIGVLQVLTRAELLGRGSTRRGLVRELRRGAIVRARRDRYLSAGAVDDVRRAVTVGGRLTCLSRLQMLGIFVFENTRLHVHVERGASRLRSADDAGVPSSPRGVRPEILHWMPLIAETAPDSAVVNVIDALAHAVLCQTPRHAVATLDSALNLGLANRREVRQLFAALPARFRVLKRLVDARAQSGPETLVRLWVRALGCAVIPQQWFAGVGYVDLFVDGWLVIECDSRGFHSSWEQRKEDFRRDLALGRLGYCVMRLNAEDILYRPEEVLAAITGVIGARRAPAST